MGNYGKTVRNMQDWLDYTESNELCLTWTKESPNCKEILESNSKIWVRVEISHTGNSLLVLEQDIKHDW